MSQKNLVQRLISYLKRPDALNHDRREPVHNPYDDYEPLGDHAAAAPCAGETPQEYVQERTPPLVTECDERTPGYGSRLDALVMRAIQQFNAQFGFVIRYDENGHMRYLTGRDLQGRYIEHTQINPDRRALLTAIDSGQSQLFMHNAGNAPLPVLCGPLWVGNEVVGLLYLDGPARSRLHRGVFDVFCEQAARMLHEGTY